MELREELQGIVDEVRPGFVIVPPPQGDKNDLYDTEDGEHFDLFIQPIKALTPPLQISITISLSRRMVVSEQG